jgi:uncharacterized membrane protein
MLEYFHVGHFSEGIIAGIRQVVEKLKDYFPYRLDNKNELFNDISMEDQT